MPVWLVSLFTGQGAKIIGTVVLLAALIGSAWLWHRNGYNIGYREGYEKASALPRNTFTAPATINQQVDCPEPSVFGLTIGKWGLGLVHKR